MKLIFDTHGNDKQKEVARAWIDNTTDEIVYGGSKGSGKSYLGCSLIFGDAFIYPETHYFIAREALNDLRKHTLPSIFEVFSHWGITKEYYNYNAQDCVFTLCNGSKVFLIEAKYYPSDPLYERFGSMQMTRGWIEEAGQISEEAKNNLSATIGRWKNDVYNLRGKLLQTCNPAKNYLYKIYKAHKDGILEKWIKFIQALPNDNKRLPKGYIERLEKALSKNQKERLLFGNWEYDDDPTALCEYDKIVDLFSNNFPALKDGDRYITCDVARLGSDKIVIGLWYGWIVTPYVFSKKRITESYKFIDQLRQKYNVPLSNVICDEDGVGGGLVDMLSCKGFVNNSRPLNGENYENLQAQCAYILAERINTNGIYFKTDDTEIQEETIEELEQLKQKNIDGDGKKGIVGKEHVKSMIGRSPDYRDMLLMRMYFTLANDRLSFY